MKKTSKPIVFFGSGPVATKSLEYLIKHFDVSEVVTKPTTLKEMEHVCPSSVQVHVVANKKELDNLVLSRKLSCSLGIVVDFGIIISKATIDYFQFGIINSHFSLLPQWRGADPIVFSILSGQDKTGVSLMLINEKLDEGELIGQEKVAIETTATTPTLTNDLIEKSNDMLRRKIPKYLRGELAPYSQPKDGVSYSRKLTKDDGLLDWNKNNNQLEREIRAYIEWPKSRATLGDVEVIVTGAHSLPSASTEQTIGRIEVVENDKLLVHCLDGYLSIDRLKPIGKKEMPVKAFLAGYSSRLET